MFRHGKHDMNNIIQHFHYHLTASKVVKINFEYFDRMNSKLVDKALKVF